MSAGKKSLRNFTREERANLAHALDHLLQNKIAESGCSGWYCGNRVQFIKRHMKAINFVRSLILV